MVRNYSYYIGVHKTFSLAAMASGKWQLQHFFTTFIIWSNSILFKSSVYNVTFNCQAEKRVYIFLLIQCFINSNDIANIHFA